MCKRKSGEQGKKSSTATGKTCHKDGKVKKT
jgi:hypothetical protein